jgi:tetratricopeptide (TPR) repeat protein
MSANVHQNAFIIRPQKGLLQQHPELKRAGNALALKYVFHELVTEKDLQAIGRGLWQALDIGNEFSQSQQMAGRHILPIIIESDDAAMQQLPWEALWHPEHGFLGKSAAFTLFRSFPGAPSDSSTPETGPLRVLLFTSLPGDLDAERSRLDVEEEQAQVQEALMPWTAAGMARLEMPYDGRFSTFKRLLKDFQPHLLFLSGHGKFHHQPHTGEAPFGVFLFESEDGFGSNPVRDSDIAQAFIGSRVQCVVLSACESGKAASDTLNNGLTSQLSRIGIPHVIGMRESILDRAGILFARHLCDALASKERIDVALQSARHAISRPLQDSTWREPEGDGLSELSLGQWCLPMLISKDAALPLIDWDFTPQPPASASTNQSLSSVSLPPRFLGRRAELRQLKERLRSGRLRQLLITGPGGQGKTALAGKLAQDLQQLGYEILAWSARLGNPWKDFLFELERQLSEDNAKRYDRMRARCQDESQMAHLLLQLLLSQTENRIVLFFDNLESLQDPDTLELQEPRLEAWIQAARSLSGQGLILLLTSRWQFHGWPNKDHWGLEHATYGDFLQMAGQLKLPKDFFRNRNRLRLIYETLHGNGRGLGFFAAASRDMNTEQESAFLEKLAEAEAETQADMAIARIYQHLGSDERQMLQRLTVYHTPVPMEGVIKLALDLPGPPFSLLDRLLAVSLVEKQYTHDWQTYEYQCSPLVLEWLEKQGTSSPDRDQYVTAARYQYYLFRRERRNLTQAIIVQQALQKAGETDEADRFALDYIVGRLSLHGFFRTLLNDWLPAICRSGNRQIKAEALGQTGKQHLHLGDYDTALQYLKQSLAIQQEIGDKSGEGATLNNISQKGGISLTQVYTTCSVPGYGRLSPDTLCKWPISLQGDGQARQRARKGSLQDIEVT